MWGKQWCSLNALSSILTLRKEKPFLTPRSGQQDAGVTPCPASQAPNRVTCTRGCSSFGRSKKDQDQSRGCKIRGSDEPDLPPLFSALFCQTWGRQAASSGQSGPGGEQSKPASLCGSVGCRGPGSKIETSLG